MGFTVQNANRRKLLPRDEGDIRLFGLPQEYLWKAKMLQALALWVVVPSVKILAHG
jgi:hypothetical protein